MNYEKFISSLKVEVLTPPDGSMQGVLGTVTWTRIPYAADVRRDWHSQLAKEIPQVRLTLREFGEKDRVIVYSLSEHGIVRKSASVIEQHLRGPRDLS